MNGRLPNLLVIGAMKSGTSSLHEYLNEHPDIFMSVPKEIHYYADSNNLSQQEYKSLFKTDKKIVGTSPQSYTKCHNKFYQNIPERIFKDTPDVKLIYIVRDPIERYRSHILESYHCDPPEDIDYSAESGNYWKTSMYGMQLKAYLPYFGLDKIHVLALEELNDAPLSEMNKIFKFLGLPEMSTELPFKKHKNRAESKGIPRWIKMHFLFRLGIKINRKYTERLAHSVARRFYKKQLQKPDLFGNDLKDLKDMLQSDINQFRLLTGKSFSKWSI